MVNLLSNAIKYNRENGSVSVDCCKIRPDTLRISVTDTGPGIRASDQSLLFKPFHRLTEHHMHVKGAGIGLTISRRLIHLMHGNMGCDSTPGTGSTFWLELPLASR
ncbi:MAG: hypothetical protein GWO08_08280 [Gammaproteobacteria bacterium]|nr:hypothetical protein [Gammaproteobacteria bacterium]